MPSIPAFSFRLGLGPDDRIDLLPRRDEEPNVFVPFHYEYLSDAFRRHFPGEDTRGLATHDTYTIGSKLGLDFASRSKIEQDDKKSIKRQRNEDKCEQMELDCEPVFSKVDGEQVLGLLQRGSEPVFYDTLAVVVLHTRDNVAKGAKSKDDLQRDTTHEDKMIDLAWKQRGGDAATSVRMSGILLGHIVLNRMQQTNHPVNYLDQSLLRNGWTKISKAVITLQPPFLPPAADVFGPSSSHAVGRAAPTLTVELGGHRVWRDSVTKTVWTNCPHPLLPAPLLFGTVHLQIEVTDKALTYGTAKEHDGFVDHVTVPRRDLILSGKLKNLIWACVDSTDGLLSTVSDDDEFWNRTPTRYYDGAAPPPLILDNRIETALEATRPRLDSPLHEASSTIKTSLLPFQKRALAWMIFKEVSVQGDEGALLPHWITVKSRQSCLGEEEAGGDYKRRKIDEANSDIFYMDTFTGTLSQVRMVCRQSEPGGCLCDEMGLGKSLSALSLIETHQRIPSYIDHTRTAQMTAEMKNELRPFVSQSTLLVIPSSLVHQWYSEINKHLKLDEEEDKIGYVLRYKRDITIPWTANDDRQAIREQARARFTGEDQPRIVLATYEDLSKELHISKRSKKAISPLLDIHWWRVMLDEAQLVSTSNGSAAEMVNCLWRTNGWIVTSTPFNSSIRDMHGLLTFLDSDFASKKLFEEIIALPFLAGDIVGVERAHGLLKRIMWRHRKEHVESELGLPPSSMQTLLLEKKGLEKTLYDREHKAMLAMVKSAVGVGRSLTKKQQDILLSLRKLISHPQLAANLGYGGPGAQRSTFANLFADLIFRNQGELYNVQMEYIVLILKIAAGKKFRKEEKDEETWKGGMSKITGLQEKLLRAREYARQAEARDIVSHKVAVTKKTVQETEEPPQEGEKKGSEEQQQQSSEKALETQTESEEKAEDGAKAETGKEDTGKAAAPITMRYDEALYWIDVLLHPKADMTDTSVIFDPERLTNFFFEKRIIEANSVDVDDPRYHAIELDAGDEEEESKGEAEGGSSAISSEAVLLKNRFRGTSKRSVQKVWYYHPRRKLQALCRDVPRVEDRIARLEGEAAYLENRIREELGEERARLALKEGFDALQASHGDKDGEKANICPLCYDQIEVPGILPCLHTACFACLLDCIAKMGQGGKTPCPMCRKPFERTDVIEVLPSLDESDHMNEFGVKISGVISHIRRQLQVDPNLKIVIFSAWSTHLRYLTEALNNLTEPILSVAFSGKSQSRALREFQNNNQVRIILVPMKMAEGAAGLTLNVASVAYLLEPSLDSALENQALGRLNRIGQKADKTTYFRVLAQNTIEPALVQIAERRLKELKDKDADTRHHDTLSVDELAFIFGLDVKEEKARRKVELQSRAVPQEAQIRQRPEGLGDQSVEVEIEDEVMQEV